MSQGEPLIAQIIAVTGQLATDVQNKKVKQDWTVDELLNYFRKFNINLSKQDLYSMVKQEPIKNFITNIQGDRVVFKGQKNKPALDGPPPAPEDQKKVVKQMAKKAMK